MFDYDVVAQGLLRTTNWFSNFSIWFCGMASSMEAAFEESYEVRAMLHTERVLGLGHAQDVAHAHCDLMVGLQGAHEENMYDMGYGYDKNKDGMVQCSCVADCSSVARAIIETVKAYPEYSKNSIYIESLRKFIDHVLKNYVADTGIIGVGILDHKINPMPDYWCANGLFSEVLVSFADLTGETGYYDAAVAPMEFLATFDYKNTDWKEWNISPQMVILYSGEGILEGLTSKVMKKKLDIMPRGVIKKSPQVTKEDTSECCEQAANRVIANVDDPMKNVASSSDTIYELLEQRWNTYTDWLYKNQSLSGVWKQPSGHDYRDYEPALSWMIFRAICELGTGKNLKKSVERQLFYLISQEAKGYFGLFCRPFSTALAHLSFAYIAEKCLESDPAGFEKALTEARKNDLNLLW